MQLDPVPRTQPNTYVPFDWPAGKKHTLIVRDTPLEIDIAKVVERRESRRSFTKPLSEILLGEFLWLACRNRSVRSGPYGTDQESRVYPSAGAMHPIHVMVSCHGDPWMRYDPVDHALVELPDSNNAAIHARQSANRLLELNQGIIFGLIAEPGRTAAKYEHHQTLVWRDAGVVLGFMSLIAEALSLAFCPLGITGQPYLTDFLSHENRLQAVGMAVLGLE